MSNNTNFLSEPPDASVYPSLLHLMAPTSLLCDLYQNIFLLSLTSQITM